MGLHVLLLAPYGYMRFGLVELLVPFANHYRSWALALYAASALTVVGLTAARLAAARRPAASRPLERSAASEV